MLSFKYEFKWHVNGVIYSELLEDLSDNSQKYLLSLLVNPSHDVLNHGGVSIECIGIKEEFEFKSQDEFRQMCSETVKDIFSKLHSMIRSYVRIGLSINPGEYKVLSYIDVTNQCIDIQDISDKFTDICWNEYETLGCKIDTDKHRAAFDIISRIYPDKEKFDDMRKSSYIVFNSKDTLHAGIIVAMARELKICGASYTPQVSVEHLEKLFTEQGILLESKRPSKIVSFDGAISKMSK